MHLIAREVNDAIPNTLLRLRIHSLVIEAFLN